MQSSKNQTVEVKVHLRTVLDILEY